MKEEFRENLMITKWVFSFIGLVMIFICTLVIWCVPQGGYEDMIEINGIRFWRETVYVLRPGDKFKHEETRYYLISPEPVELKEFQSRYFEDMLSRLKREKQ